MGMRRLLTISILGGLLASSVWQEAGAGTKKGGAPGMGSAQIAVSLLRPGGRPMVGATAGVFLHPFDHGRVFAAPPLVLGEADGEGNFSFSLADDRAARAEAAKSVGGVINVEIRALDHQTGWMVSVPTSVPVFGGSRMRLSANVDLRGSRLTSNLSSGDVFGATRVRMVSSGCKDARPDKPMCHRLLAKRKRPVKIATLHVARAMKGTFVFRDARETTHQTLTRICYPEACNDWQAGSFRRENRSRGNSTKFPRRGSYRRVMRAVYEERLYEYCSTGQTLDNCERKTQYWEPHVWTGGLNVKMRPNVPDHVKFNRYYAWRLHGGREFRAERQSNQTFGLGLTLLGYGLKSQTGYSKTTALVWKGLPGCRRRWLYGHRKHPTQAGAIYARSRGCG